LTREEAEQAFRLSLKTMPNASIEEVEETPQIEYSEFTDVIDEENVTTLEEDGKE
jgi:hypothetical protein